VIPDVAAGDPGDVAAGMLHHHRLLDRRAALQRRVRIGLQRDLAAAAQALVGGHDDVGIAVLNAPGQRIRREAAEHHRVNGADPGAGQHRNGELRDHRQVDRDPVPPLRADRLQRVGELAHLAMQLAIGELPVDRRIVALPDDRHLVAAALQVPVEAVVRGVQGTVVEPFDVDIAGSVRHVFDLGVRLEPGDPLAVLSPKPLRVGNRAAVHLLVIRFVDPCLLGPFLGHRKDFLVHSPVAPLTSLD
jgi:hypothetical protein